MATTWPAELAKSGRSSCKKCKGAIEKGALRVGKQFEDEAGHARTMWYHVGCWPVPRALVSVADDVVGWDALSEEHRQAIRDRVGKKAGGSPSARAGRSPRRCSPAQAGATAAGTVGAVAADDDATTEEEDEAQQDSPISRARAAPPPPSAPLPPPATQDTAPSAADAGPSDEDTRPWCKFGANCFRTSAEHRAQYRHADDGAPADASRVDAPQARAPRGDGKRRQKRRRAGDESDDDLDGFVVDSDESEGEGEDAPVRVLPARLRARRAEVKYDEGDETEEEHGDGGRGVYDATTEEESEEEATAPTQAPTAAAAAAAAAPAERAEWQVRLGGSFRAYDPPVQAQLEGAHAAGAVEARIEVRGIEYSVSMREMRQVVRADASRWRPVRRVVLS